MNYDESIKRNCTVSHENKHDIVKGALYEYRK